MKIEDIIWDIKEIRGALEDDSDLEEMWLLHKINSYRALAIQQEFSMTNSINPQWLQRVHKFKLTKCTPADDPSIGVSSIYLSKGTLPKVISLPEDIGTYRVAGSGAITQFEPVDLNTLLMKIDIGEEMNSVYGFYSKVGSDLYFYPLTMEASAVIIAENPMDVQVLDGGVLRGRTFLDDYPVDIALAQKIVLEILTKDLAIADGTITDIVNDSQNKFKILKDEGSNSPRS